jgi:hypothetical protein
MEQPGKDADTQGGYEQPVDTTQSLGRVVRIVIAARRHPREYGATDSMLGVDY